MSIAGQEQAFDFQPVGMFLHVQVYPAVVAHIGGKAKELVFTARRLYAEEAKQLGLVYAIVGQESAMAEAREFAGRFRHASTENLRLRFSEAKLEV